MKKEHWVFMCKMMHFMYISTRQETVGSGLYRLYNVLCLVMKYTLGSSAPSYIFHNQHKTLNNLNLLLISCTFYDVFSAQCLISYTLYYV